MKLLTNRQEEIWRKKMVQLEKRIIGYHATNPLKQVLGRDEPDGSFCMSAFKAGYYLRGRK